MPSFRNRWETLTQQEKEVANLLRAGYSTRQIVDALSLRHFSLRGLAYYVCVKLQVNNADELNREMTQIGL